jgi:dihydrofolate synthase/folylpolyglutamate synthase
LPLFPKKAIIIFVNQIPRGLEALYFTTKKLHFQLKGKVYNSVSEAYKALKTLKTDFIYVGEGTFVVAEIL